MPHCRSASRSARSSSRTPREVSLDVERLAVLLPGARRLAAPGQRSTEPHEGVGTAPVGPRQVNGLRLEEADRGPEPRLGPVDPASEHPGAVNHVDALEEQEPRMALIDRWWRRRERRPRQPSLMPLHAEVIWIPQTSPRRACDSMSPSSASMFFSRSSTASVFEPVPCIVVEGKRRTLQPPVRVRDCVSDQRALPVGEYAVQPLAAVRSRVDEGLEVAGDLSAFDPFDDRR